MDNERDQDWVYIWVKKGRRETHTQFVIHTKQRGLETDQNTSYVTQKKDLLFMNRKKSIDCVKKLR